MTINYLNAPLNEVERINSLVSIIVPVYNREKTIERCIDSLLSQTYSNCEIIIVNDGSTDGTEDILDKFGNKIKNVNQVNSGVSVARNNGVNASNGEFIAFCDSDDYVSNTYIEDLISVYETGCLSISAFCREECLLGGVDESFAIDEKSILSSRTSKLFEKYYLQGPYCKLFNKKILLDNNIIFSPDMNFGEDFKFVMDYLMVVDQINFFNKYDYYYEKSFDGLTNKVSNKKIRSFVYLTDTYKQFIEKKFYHQYQVLCFYNQHVISDYLSLCIASFKVGFKYGCANRKRMISSPNIKAALLEIDNTTLDIKAKIILKTDNILSWILVWILLKIRRYRKD